MYVSFDAIRGFEKLTGNCTEAVLQFVHLHRSVSQHSMRQPEDVIAKGNKSEDLSVIFQANRVFKTKEISILIGEFGMAPLVA